MRLLKTIRIAITNCVLVLFGIAAGEAGETEGREGKGAGEKASNAAGNKNEKSAPKTSKKETAKPEINVTDEAINAYEKDFQDLADYRKRKKMPEAGSENDDSTAAKLIIGDNEYYGKNAGQTKADVIEELIVNPQTATHAEGDVFYQAKTKKDGVNSTKATIILDRYPCKSCGINGGIRGMAKQLGITDLTIVTPSRVVKFNPQIKPKPNPFM